MKDDGAEAPINQMDAVVSQIKRLPYLSILFLLLVTIFGLYNMNHIGLACGTWATTPSVF